ncbi:toxin-antitoxin system YwqK family antitoxin [Chromobacterium sp.]|uniref:toxin-antitoxin system YwqK family antitoxin n=1 Tax=Chromobacterium sp. TaxID=306190 RepID=UPI0035B107DB
MLRVDEGELDYSVEQICIYAGVPFSGVAYEEVAGGLISEAMYVDGLLDGTVKIWYSSGKPFKEESYRRNYLHGCCVEWFEHGGVKIACSYECGILIKRKEWDVMGGLIGEYGLTPSAEGYELLEIRRHMWSEGRR